MFENLGPMEMLLIVLIVIVLFGAKRVPEIAASVGKGIREFKHAMQPDNWSLDGAVQRDAGAPRPMESATAGPDEERRDSPKRLMEQAVGPRDEVGEPPAPGVE